MMSSNMIYAKDFLKDFKEKNNITEGDLWLDNDLVKLMEGYAHIAVQHEIAFQNSKEMSK